MDHRGALRLRRRRADLLQALEKRQQELFERVAPSVVSLSTPAGFGSGFFVDKTGLVLTNAHVLGSAQTLDVVLHDGRRLCGEVVERASDGVDLVLVKVPIDNAPALSRDGAADLSVGSWVGAVGHGKGGVWTFNVGMVSNIYPDGAARPVFQTQIPLNPG